MWIGSVSLDVVFIGFLCWEVVDWWKVFVVKELMGDDLILVVVYVGDFMDEDCLELVGLVIVVI